MIHLLLFLFISCIVTEGTHFNGGTIMWKPINPTINSSIVPITITQLYSWTYSRIICATNVPVSTPGRSSSNASLICMSDCSTDGGYSLKPVSILTDCQTVIASMNLLTSQRTVNINLTAGAHFYLAYVGSAWAPLNNPTKSDLQWSIVCSIDLRIRPDGIINTPPVASVVSPQYVIVNQTTQINIPVSDANPGDDVRCRWSVYTPGSRRRKRFFDEEEQEEYVNHNDVSPIYKEPSENQETIHIRNKRTGCNKGCSGSCTQTSRCCCSACIGTTCSGTTCTTSGGCPVATTTIDTPGTLASTLSYPNQQAIDECGGICYPGSVPTSTTLSNCTVTFTGPVANTWYAVAIQVEDFINDTSQTPMSSVPVQFLIYVMDTPTCGLAPVIFPISRCFDAQVGVTISFNLSAMTLCDPNVSGIDSIVIVSGATGMNSSDTVNSLTNASISYSTFVWEPLSSQLGSQQLCVIAYSDEQLQSPQYCVTFNVITSSATCITTSTTSSTTSSTISSTSTSSSITTTTTITSTSASTSTTSIATTATSTSMSSTSIATTTSMTSISTTYVTTTTTSNTTVTTVAITTVITTKTTNTSGSQTNWPLILGLSLLSLLLVVGFSCFCLYKFCCSSAAKRRRQIQPEEISQRETINSSDTPTMTQDLSVQPLIV